ncbi:MAG: hypothetical protein II758_02835, partial [Prevotella sp.]|nr:hypothetical protein [Prevotella sp.]
NWRKDVYKLLNRHEHKFQKSVIIAGGVSFFGTINLIILEGTMNHFAYGQTLLFYQGFLEDFSFCTHSDSRTRF